MEKLSTDMIYLRGEVNDALVWLKGISGKLDTIIALKQAELQRQNELNYNARKRGAA